MPPRTRKLFPTPDDAETAFYEAFERADLAAMMVVWAEGEDVVCVHPSGPRLTGFEAVRESWMQIFASNVKLNVRVSEASRFDGPSVAVRSVVEAITAPGTESSAAVRERDQRLRPHRLGMAHRGPPRLAPGTGRAARGRRGGAAPHAALKPRPALARLAAALLALALAAPAAAQPDPRKVVRTAYPSAESKLDPAAESDEASGSISHAIFDPMLAYDFLARPAKLVGNTASLPEITDGGATFTLRIRPGIFFAPDPAFGGKPRELTAHDYVYSIKRLFDPKLRSQWLFLVEGKILGADEAMKAAKESGRFDFDRPIEGLQAPDRYTVRIRLANPDYSFPYVLAMPATAALAREVVERYGQDISHHPVGTGPYRIAEWVKGSRIVLEANPGYREEVFDGRPRPRRGEPRHPRAPQGPAAADRGAHRDPRRGRGAAALARVPQRRARLHPAAAGGLRQHRAARRKARAQPRKSGHLRHARRGRLHHLHDVQHGRRHRRQAQRDRRVRARARGAAARHRHGLPHRRADGDPRQGAERARAHAAAARRSPATTRIS